MRKNRSSYTFSTESGNNYMQNVKENVLIYLPPRLKEILDGGKADDDEYYQQKKEFIEKYLNDDYDMAENYSNMLSPGFVRRNIINTNQITFEVTDACNLNCEYCGYGELYGGYDGREDKFLKWEMAKSIIDYSAELWRSEEYPSYNKKVAIGFYGGEPLLNIKVIKQIIAYLEQLNLPWIKFKYVMTTNGMLLDKYIDYLIEKDVHISVSLDGNKENNAYRVTHNHKESFSFIYKNLLYVKEKYPTKFDVNISFLSVLHNKNSMSDIHGFFKTHFGKNSSVSEVSPNNIKEDKKKEFAQMYLNKYESLKKATNYDQIKEDIFMSAPENTEMMFYLSSYSGNMIRDYNNFFNSNENTHWLPTGTCTPFGKRMFITVNGKILPCERISQIHALGYIDENGVHLDEEKIAQKYNELYNKVRPMCKKCHKLKGCLKCIFHIKGIDDSESIDCDWFANEGSLTRYLSTNISLLEKDNKIYNRIMKEVVMEM